MLPFLARRAIHSVVLLLIVSVIGFVILHLAPGGPLSQFAASGDMSQADLDRLSAQLGLDRPLPIQYVEWLWRMLKGDWGLSYRDQHAVTSIIASHIGATLELMFCSTLLAMFIGACIGILGAVRRYSLFDSIATVGAMIALSIPTFWFGIVVIYVFAVHLNWLPAGNRMTEGDGSFFDYVHHLIGPCVVLALVTTAAWSRYMRSSMLEVINQDYIRTARAKGVPEYQIVMRHALRNALLPMITITGLHVPTLLSGALVTETVFTWPGIGRLFFDSISYRDYPTVMGILMFSAVLVLLGNLIADLLYGFADPRIAGDHR
ncbi:peptide/nickel transport system permease protein [Paraburkholderia sp. BL6665CI2N2]|uniref:ABC transporter permease n=1 Tax=Paraburkholderia sp. BL6665CI2N2 TaxID=1938806 RepID=UPI001065F43B|nr:ABC transporter permease [Paraburkholderia sp. BL6665CI2N2]TDY16837.1 peptide/nickel transport system permease protein [Paraburkholderia sp. BL6665CI2N2]